MNIMDDIRKWQQDQPRIPVPRNIMVHKPGMLYIGCIDARLDPLALLGIQPGDALIYRNPGAQVRAYTPENALAENLDIAATLELAVQMGIKEIAVVGHTNCGAIAACHHNSEFTPERFPSLTRYLAPFKKLWSAMFDAHPGATDDKLHDLTEQESVRLSVRNLAAYPPVKTFLEKGGHIHGLVIDIRDAMLYELNQESGAFEAIASNIGAKPAERGRPPRG